MKTRLKRRLVWGIAGLISVLLFWNVGGDGRAQDAPGLACAPGPVPLFTATLDGRPLELHGFRSGSFAIFAMDFHSEVVIRTGFDVSWVDVRPLSAQVAYTIGPDHRDIRIPIKDATPLTLEFNDDLGQVVHLFPCTARQG